MGASVPLYIAKFPIKTILKQKSCALMVLASFQQTDCLFQFYFNAWSLLIVLYLYIIIYTY